MNRPSGGSSALLSSLCLISFFKNDMKAEYVLHFSIAFYVRTLEQEQYFFMTQTFEKQKHHNMVGKAIRRQDGADKVTGRTRYAGDLPVAGLLHARLVLSPYAHARIVNIDTSQAMAVPGVKAVYTGETLGMVKRESSSRSQAPLALHETLWCGHPVAIVLAENEAAAEDGAAAVDIDYEPLTPVMDPLAAMQPASPPASTRKEGEVSEIAGGGAHAAVAKEEEHEHDKEELSQNVSDKAHFHA